MTDQTKKKITLQPGCVSECPGCAHKYLTREQSLAQKEKWLKNRLSPWAAKLDPIRAVDEKSGWGYRGKVNLSTRWENEKWQFGLIKKDTLIPIHHCPIHTGQVRDAVLLFSSCLPPADRFPLSYFVQTGDQITLVVKSKQMPELHWFDGFVSRALKKIGITGLWLHLHPAAGKKIFAKNSWHLLYGSPRSADKNQHTYGPRAFQQLIPGLYNQALISAERFLAPAEKDIFVDLYCGIGVGLARWQQYCRNIMGVELDGETVACARENAIRSQVLRGKCSHRIPQLIHWTESRPPGGKRLLYVNPPRTGLEPDIIHWITAQFKPDRMAYLSCSAGTLHRDLSQLEISGFKVIQITPYDFFPHTLHVETMVFLQSEK